ncbi:hypothetical protein MJO28_012370 [Puccinia striiformis f. sp. tritici]|nr:hypothetical protein MJO28_012366 [Puccinia striiformis f. sp. tritici]KAI7942343.1 hypothetical protein MJO28_012370 [Puccinia striiformis f. sp. tritici]KAI7945669.1 hypothetical protein MJO29_012057 [Puccinia striiformis f. sp. tritici]POW17657.1 hypothetical protein PSTT_00495 [Puccinia striiformis]POW20638.1 hypothetical protein PSHT_03364 [Puccinia striiformis]
MELGVNVASAARAAGSMRSGNSAAHGIFEGADGARMGSAAGRDAVGSGSSVDGVISELRSGEPAPASAEPISATAGTPNRVAQTGDPNKKVSTLAEKIYKNSIQKPWNWGYDRPAKGSIGYLYDNHPESLTAEARQMVEKSRQKSKMAEFKNTWKNFLFGNKKAPKPGDSPAVTPGIKNGADTPYGWYKNWRIGREWKAVYNSPKYRSSLAPHVLEKLAKEKSVISKFISYIARKIGGRSNRA